MKPNRAPLTPERCRRSIPPTRRPNVKPWGGWEHSSEASESEAQSSRSRLGGKCTSRTLHRGVTSQFLCLSCAILLFCGTARNEQRVAARSSKSLFEREGSGGGSALPFFLPSLIHSLAGSIFIISRRTRPVPTRDYLCPSCVRHGPCPLTNPCGGFLSHPIAH
jgi:hypothetical protein